jgi:uncharacterized protein (TIGR02284 family)
MLDCCIAASGEGLMRTQDTVRILNRLTRVCRDGERFCRACARPRVSAELRRMLRDRSEEWARLGDELQALVLLLNGEPVTSGTLAAGPLRAWLALRTMLPGSSDAAIVEAWVKMQREAWERYAEAVSGYLPERIRRTVGLQADRISDRSDQIAALQSGVDVLAGRAPRAV